jgi:hypothetical protein
MNTPDAEFDLFITFAKAQMGDFKEENSTTLAYVFKDQTDLSGPSSYPNFWQIGCVFDTVLDYFLTLKEAGELGEEDKTLMKQLMLQAVKGYQYGIVGLEAAWYDDWCWWGIAASKAFEADYEDIFGDQIEFFQNAAIDLWGLVDTGDFATLANNIPDDVWGSSATMSDKTRFTKGVLSDRSQIHTGTRGAWDLILGGEYGTGTERQNADYKYFTTKGVNQWAAPRFSGGCWQYDLSTKPFPPNDGPAWQNPNPNAQGLGVFQVTLMSGLHLSFACSLMAAAKRKAAGNESGNAWSRLESCETYQKSAKDVIGFLTDWFEVEGTDSLVAKAFPKGWLVHERTPTYDTLTDGAHPFYPAVQAYFPDAYWGGDQGLIMGALWQYSQLETLHENAQEFPMELLKGVFYNMPALNLPRPAQDLPNAVGPYLDPSGKSPLSWDEGDYGSGSGIFWRYVLRCCRLDPCFKAEASADAKVASMAEVSGENPNTWGNELFQPFNTVAAAIGAWYLLKRDKSTGKHED